MASAAARPLTDAKRRTLVRSAIGPMVYRLSAATIAAIADDCAGLELDAPATLTRAAAWGRACRQALDAGEPLPVTLEGAELDALAAAAAAAAPVDVARLDDIAAARRRSGAA